MATRLCCAYLRVYQPAASLSEAELASIARATKSDAKIGSAFGLLAPDECAEVYAKEIDGQLYYCPTHTRLRWLLALLAFERSTPEAVPLFFSRDEVVEARRELDSIERAFPGVRAPIVQSMWHVPPQWFVCFDDAERRIEHDGDYPRIRYETSIAMARQRVDNALETVTGGIVHPVIVGVIYELKEWLKGFAQDAIIELDYASVAMLFEPDDLADDHSAADVWSAIAAFGEGDGMKAGQFYRRVSARWVNSASSVGSLN